MPSYVSTACLGNRGSKQKASKAVNYFTPRKDEKKRISYELQEKRSQRSSNYIARRTGNAEGLHGGDLSILDRDRLGQNTEAAPDLLWPELIFGHPRRVIRPRILVHRGRPSLQWEDTKLHPHLQDMFSFQAVGLQTSCGIT